jgi:hypothetical protein
VQAWHIVVASCPLEPGARMDRLTELSLAMKSPYFRRCLRHVIA